MGQVFVRGVREAFWGNTCPEFWVVNTNETPKSPRRRGFQAWGTVSFRPAARLPQRQPGLSREQEGAQEEGREVAGTWLSRLWWGVWPSVTKTNKQKTQWRVLRRPQAWFMFWKITLLIVWRTLLRAQSRNNNFRWQSIRFTQEG